MQCLNIGIISHLILYFGEKALLWRTISCFRLDCILITCPKSRFNGNCGNSSVFRFCSKVTKFFCYFTLKLLWNCLESTVEICKYPVLLSRYFCKKEKLDPYIKYVHKKQMQHFLFALRKQCITKKISRCYASNMRTLKKIFRWGGFFSRFDSFDILWGDRSQTTRTSLYEYIAVGQIT